MFRKFVFTDHAKPLREETEKIPDAPPGGLVLKVTHAGLCYSDVHFWKHKGASITKEGDVIGHEIAGTVHSLGSDVTGLQLGQRVSLYVWRGCQDCIQCTAHPYKRLCPGLWENCHGIGLPGGFEQYVLVSHAWQARPVPQDLPMEVAALCSCGALTAYNSVKSALPALKLGASTRGYGTLLLLGAGGLGLWAVTFAKALLGEDVRIYVTDVKADPFPVAQQRGAVKGVLLSRDSSAADSSKAIREAIGHGADAVIDFAGNPRTFEVLYRCLNIGGSFVMVGIQGGPVNIPSINLAEMATNLQSFLSVRVGDVEQMDEMMNFVAKHKLEGPPITTIPFDCAQLSQKIADLSEGKVTGRIVMKCTE